MKFRTLIVLAAAVGLLLAFIWFYERELPSSYERVELAARLFRFDAEDVTALEFEQGEDRIRLERIPAKEDGGGDRQSSEWTLVDPLSARADRDAVENVLERLVGLTQSRSLEEVDLSEAGLAEPRAAVTVERGSTSEVLGIGSDVPASETMLVSVEGRAEVYVVANLLWSDLQKSVSDWRSRDVFTGDREEIDRIEISGIGGVVEFSRREDTFRITRPIEDRADEDLVSNLLSDLADLQVESFLEEGQENGDLGFEPPSGSVRVSGGAGVEPFSIEFGSPVPGEAETIFARFSGETITTRSPFAEAIGRLPEEWQSHSLTGFESWEIDSVRVQESGSEALELSKDEGAWTAQDQTVEYGKVSDLLYALQDARAVRVITPADLSGIFDSRGDTGLVLELNAEERSEIVTLIEIDDGVAVRISSRQFGLLFDRETLTDLRSKLEVLRLDVSAADSGSQAAKESEAAVP